MRISRRQLMQGAGVAGLGLIVGCGRRPWEAPAAARVPRVGFLALGPFPWHEGFRHGLRTLGYVEGQNLTVDFRYAEREDQFPALARELTQLPVQVIVTGGVAATIAAQQATSAIPIVMGSSTGPVEAGLIASLAQPGGNVTGLTNLSPQLNGKWLELLREVVPEVQRVAVLLNPDNPTSANTRTEMDEAAQRLGLSMQILPVRSAVELEGVLGSMLTDGAEALVVARDALLNAQRRRVVEFAASHRLPAMGGLREFADDGGLLAYGPSVTDSYRRAAAYVDKILKGARPGDLPVEQAMQFDFVINLQTAQALGLTIPQQVLRQATEVIQ
jgi:putative ABC transport system substrate-binding protein